MSDTNGPQVGNHPSDPVPAPFTAFDTLARKLMGVPKAEIDMREVEYRKQQAKKPKRGPKPKT